MSKNRKQTNLQQLEEMLRGLGLKAFVANYQSVAQACDKSGATHLQYLSELCALEEDRRVQERLDRLLKAAKLPRNKLLKDFEINRIAGLSPALIEMLATGDFIDRAENILIFGNPGTGKSHLSVALARQWCLHGRRTLYVSASQLTQDLLEAQTQNKLHQLIKKLDRFECLLIDDISYIPLPREATDGLFQLLSERYERRSTLITSNLAFSQWTTIFKDEMTTAAVIDRLVHHCEILELNAPSYRAQAAERKKAASTSKAKDDAMAG
jgi:DNA replication protein DnaC